MAGTGHDRPLLDIRLLGAVQAYHAGEPLNLGGMQARGLLAVLLLHPGQVVPKQKLIEFAWDGDQPLTAEDLVVAYISRLRKALAPAGDLVKLTSVQPGFRADIDPACVDAHRFTALVDRAGSDRDGGEDDLAAGHLREAIGQWHGAELALADAKSDWLRAQANVLAGKRLDALERLARIDLDADRPADAAALLRDVAAHHPERENLTVTLVRALTALGESAQAAQLAAGACQALLDLGQVPGPELREAQTAALARRPQRPAAPKGPRHQLPGDTGTFTGREEELAEVLAVADAARSGSTPGAVAISAIDGMAGIGKTAFAIHAAHCLADRYPDGQLFLDLHGHTEGLAPREPGDALATLLQAFGVPPGQIPADPEARAGMYRDRLAGTSTLVLLDNASTESQVRPLLPGDGGCLVLVTSRRRLKALDDAHALSLDVLPGPDALALFRQVAGPGRAEANDPLVAEIADLCGRLPLALRIAAALLRNRRSWTTAHLAGKLRDGRIGLEGFSDGDRKLTAVFDLSYQTIDEAQRLVFRRLGLVPGPDVDAYAAAALLDTGLAEAERGLQDLVDHSLLREPQAGRYQLHDLVREHARTRAAWQDPNVEREAAIDRLLDYYQHAAQQADRHLARLTPVYVPAVDSPPGHVPTLGSREQAEAWMRAEHANLMAAAEYSADRIRPTHAVALPAAMRSRLRTHGPWAQASHLYDAAIDAARILGDHLGEANALNNLGEVRQLTGDYPGAAEALERAIALFRTISNQLGEANTLINLGIVRERTGAYLGAAQAGQRALDLFGAIGDRRGEATAVNNLGTLCERTGDYPGATDALQRALALFGDLGDQQGEANALTNLAIVRQLTGDYPGATRAYEQALGLYRDVGDRLGQANALGNLGTLRRETGDYSGAVRMLERALGFHRALGNRQGEANALANLGGVHEDTADYPRAARAYASALELQSALNSRQGQGHALDGQGNVLRLTGDYAGAAEAYESALKLFQEIGDRARETGVLNNRAKLSTATGDLDQARTGHGQALNLAREIASPQDEAEALEGLGEVDLREGRRTAGVQNLTQALEIYRRLGVAGAQRAAARLAELGEG
jgi:tetratricopeptide (TPR) repeat protein/DNA-binding SARP family transcriptional activator